jgi:hypothetical protein
MKNRGAGLWGTVYHAERPGSDCPALFAGWIYMILGRFILLTEGEHHSLIRRKWLTKILVFGDVASFMLQSSGTDPNSIG